MERNADRVLTLRYEDAVANPGQMATTLGEWLGVDPGGFRFQGIRTSFI